MSRPSWRDRASCANSNYDFTIEPTGSISREQVLDTRIACAFICASCPVFDACHAAAEDGRLDHNETVRPFGVHAGQFYDGTRMPPRPPAQSVRDSRTTLPPEQQKTLLQTLFDLGLDDEDIAERLTTTTSKVLVLRRELGLTRKKPSAECGQPGPGGAKAHRRRGEPVCPPCREAARVYDADGKNRRKAKVA